MKQELLTLPYETNALEPYIDTQTMEVHHDKHYAAYVNKLNTTIENTPELAEMTLDQMLMHLDKVPETARMSVRNNGGGVYNHDFFWNNMTPSSNKAPLGELATAINEKFESFETFKKLFKEAALAQFGSGWAWLAINPAGELEILTTPNQDTPISLDMKPMIALDVWEHAYYLKYQNKRDEYIDNWWNVVNWVRADLLYTEYKKVVAETSK